MKPKTQSLDKASSESDSSSLWPCPDYNIEKEPRFLFIITPPFSGSTALALLLSSCHGTAILQENAEGQWLIPGMYKPDKWDREKAVNWESVRSVWLKKIETIKASGVGIELIIEKSPPHLVRVDQLIKVFPNYSLIAFNRDPYANCASILYRNYNAAKESENSRLEIVSKLADDWLFRSKWIKKWIDELQLVSFTYEEFCADPAACVARLAVDIPVLQTIDVGKRIKVKDYDEQGIVNQNIRQISNLTRKEIDAISEVLTKGHKLVSFFGYDFL